MISFFLLFLIVYFALRSIYRIYFHPLRGIPGPKLAAVTHLHEFHHDVVRGGKFLWEIEKMHERYGTRLTMTGPIVRINPREVHIADPAMYDEIYAAGGRKRDKDQAMVSAYASPYAALATIDHDLHRARRAPLNPFFSKKAVLELSSVIQEKISLLAWHLEKSHAEKSVITLSTAFIGLTGDIITHYLYGQDNGYLRDRDLAKRNMVWEIMAEGTNACHLFRFFPCIPTLTKALPPRLMRLLRPTLSNVYDMQDQIARESEDALSSRRGTAKRRTIYHALNSPDVPSHERSLHRLRDESFIVLIGGAESTAATLSFAMYHLLQNREMYCKLRKELQRAMPTPTSHADWSQLERLPYLTAVINEALRLGAAALRPTRVATTETLYYKEYAIPPGTPVSTISYFVHRNPAIFPDPERFDPERWIQAAERGDNLTRYLVPFTRGSRICVGMNLANAELYMTLASVVRRFDLELCDTRPEDMEFAREMVVQRPAKGVWTLKARVAGVGE
ncbi:cytochrome P450 [Aspergillus heteromorphus CBS 117.55]|uniref:Cytochrome P450 n=1 Tax=Aspergillus heteromorphus CBS 117.55 TaxID=1448321 RepID=A0A317VRV5_9EURO|nr:cytochrome P450 [Aspergillus heteromorphus CBS 117.55]PWY77056.1 cytochrome P450 [Aspergillus heteromorphus CBS 117.55]